MRLYCITNSFLVFSFSFFIYINKGWWGGGHEIIDVTYYLFLLQKPMKYRKLLLTILFAMPKFILCRNIFDWVCYGLLLVVIVTHLVDVGYHVDLLARMHIRIMAITIILIWIRLLKNARAFSYMGRCHISCVK